MGYHRGRCHRVRVVERREELEGFIYSVSMTATESTYVYDVYRFDGDSVDVRTIDFAEVVRMASEDGSQVRTPQDALSYLNERGSALYG